MELKVRRVVTGHDARGRGVVLIDDVAGNVISERPNQERCLLWTTSGFPASNEGNEDGAKHTVSGGLSNGTVFGVVRLEPGIASKPHRTTTIDYGVIISGRLGLKLETETVWFEPGDVFIQRGTLRDWIVPGPDPCVMAVTMVGATPVVVNGEPLGRIP